MDEKRYCNRCGRKVGKNKLFNKKSLKVEDSHGIQNYEFECLNCDENMFRFETHTK